MNSREGWDAPAAGRWHELAYWGLLLLACAVMLVMNIWTPFKEDDMSFALIAGGSLHDIWQSQVDHFMTSNGRFSDVVATLFCAFLGKQAFNVCNTLVFGLLAHLVVTLGTGRRSVMALSMFLALVGCCFPVPGQTLLFVAGSCNYLWAVTASLLLVRYLRCRHDGALGWGRGLLLLLGALIAGNFNEATSFGFFGGLCLYYAVNRRELESRAVVALTGYLLGILLIVASPGAWHRAAQGGIVVGLSLPEMLSSRWHIFVEKAWRYVSPWLAAAVGLVALLWRGLVALRRHVWAFVLPCLALVLFALGVLQERAYTALTVVGFIIVAMAADSLLGLRPWWRVAVTAVSLALAAYTLSHALRQVRDYKAYEDAVTIALREAPREAILRESRYPGSSRFVTPMPYVSSGYFVRENIYCAYYGKDNVQFVSDSVYNRYHQGRLLDGAVQVPVVTDRPDLFGPMYAFPGQDYVVLLVKGGRLPFSSQQARYYLRGDAMTAAERGYRHRYGLETGFTPHGFYPLHYQGQHLLVFAPMDSTVSRVVFPVDGTREPPVECTISRQQEK